ncbi:MAG TPA: CRISPR-associated protein Cas4, partial [Thermodesulfobacterium commune]|nr:CRISPR-associated protein Cas4 [Thermodesulfobacterium commune]
MNELKEDSFDFQTLKTNGINVNYLYVCERKLWLFDRGIQMESKSDRVLKGKLLGEYSYPRDEKKEILIDNLINIDI